MDKTLQTKMYCRLSTGRWSGALRKFRIKLKNQGLEALVKMVKNLIPELNSKNNHFTFSKSSILITAVQMLVWPLSMRVQMGVIIP